MGTGQKRFLWIAPTLIKSGRKRPSSWNLSTAFTHAMV